MRWNLGIASRTGMINRIHGWVGDDDCRLWSVAGKAIAGALPPAAVAAFSSGSHGDRYCIHARLPPIFLTRAKQLSPVRKAGPVSSDVRDGWDELVLVGHLSPDCILR